MLLNTQTHFDLHACTVRMYEQKTITMGIRTNEFPFSCFGQIIIVCNVHWVVGWMKFIMCICKFCDYVSLVIV